ncbi:uncharacterized protein LOC115169314 isoform X2 [Salmo trutta]|uniref:uncharacterized protein LOC115169314 isoform X2 n=1 Tax=Salmo trutta TaxID=8032 RepID=UPI001131CE30|nr:uncharacterized protein LOC115169314 isoform X2 [Salmo trutta]
MNCPTTANSPRIHILENGEVRIFSRNQEDNTTKYPDIISCFPMVKESVVSCVLDSEAVAWNREKKQIQPFQVLTTRKRKARGGLLCLIPRPQAVRLDLPGVTSEVAVEVHKSPDCNNILSEGAKKSRAWMQLISRSKCVCVYAFDLLYLNGEPNCQKNAFICSRALLKESFEEKEGEFVFARPIDSDNTDTIVEFLEQSVRGVGGFEILPRPQGPTEASCSPATMRTMKSSSQSARLGQVSRMKIWRSTFCPSPTPIIVWTDQQSPMCGLMPCKYGKCSVPTYRCRRSTRLAWDCVT